MLKLLPEYESLENPNRYTIVKGGRGSGKSVHVVAFQLIKTYQAKMKILSTRYTLTSAEKSIIPEFEEQLENLECRDDFTITNKSITNKWTDSVILFSGIKASSGNQTANLKSLNGLDIWVLDEAEEMVSIHEFKKIDRSIRKIGGQNKVVLSLNPPENPDHWIYSEFIEADRDDTTIIHTDYRCNSHNLDPSFLADAERTKINNPEDYAHSFLGHKKSLSGRIFPRVKECDEIPKEYNYRVYGGDFATGVGKGATCFMECTVVKDSLYIREVFYTKEQISNQEICIHYGNDYGKKPQLWDSAQINDIRALSFGTEHNGRKYQMVNARPVKKKPGSVYSGIKRIWSFKNVYVLKGSTGAWNDFSKYRWAKNAAGEHDIDTYGNPKPLKEDDHACDAVRYALELVPYNYKWDNLKLDVS